MIASRPDAFHSRSAAFVLFLTASVAISGAKLTPAHSQVAWGTEPPPRWQPLEPSSRSSSSATVDQTSSYSEAQALGADLVWAEPSRQGSPDLSLAKPLALASGDFDEDGVPDLLAGYAAGNSGLLVMYRGNVAAIHPYSVEAEAMRERGAFSRAPFLSPARVFETAVRPDFVATGDFDNDGHRDVVVATMGSQHFSFLLGDGRGSLPELRELELGGRLSTATVGEINRADGIADLIVGIVRQNTSAIAVYQSLAGVLEAEPEEISSRRPVTSIALARCDDDSWFDAAAAAGNELVLLRGRDRLRPARARGEPTDEPVVDRYDLGVEIIQIAAGDFVDDEHHRADLAVLDASGDLYAVDRRSLEPSDPSRRNHDSTRANTLELRHLYRSADSGQGAANARALVAGRFALGESTTLLALDGPTSDLRLLSRGDATTRGLRDTLLGNGGKPLAALTLRLTPDTVDDLIVLDEEIIEPVTILSSGAQRGGLTFRVNEPGLDLGPLGDLLCDNDLEQDGLQCTLQEAFEEAKRLSTGSAGIDFAAPGTYDGRLALGNLISVPLDLDGSEHMSGGAPGVEIRLHSSVRLGGAMSSVRGVLLAGQALQFANNAGGNVFESNWVGIDQGGSAPNPWGGTNVNSLNAQTTFGGTASGAGNLFAGEGDLISNSEGDILKGNLVGTDSSGTVAVGSPGFQQSVGLLGANPVFGGTEPGAGNLVSGNQRTTGVVVSGAGARIQGNTIGTDITETQALGNSGAGILVQFGADDVTIGGTSPGAANVVSANAQGGVSVSSSGALVVGNNIGTSGDGSVALGNTTYGIYIGGVDAIVGSEVGDGGNLVADTRRNINGLFGDGIQLQGSSATITANLIGLGTNFTPLGNAGSGIRLMSGATSHNIGGPSFAEENEIAYNGDAGVMIEGGAGTGNEVLANSLHDNGLLGIDISFTADPDGPNTNDVGDSDSGPNDRQNHPVITAVDTAAGTIDGRLDSEPGTTFDISFYSNDACDPSGFGEGGTYLGSTQLTTDSIGSATFSVSFNGIRNPTAIATKSFAKNSSEFSPCFPAELEPAVVNSVGDASDTTPGDGACDTGATIDREGVPEPECTLRAALEEQLPNVSFDITTDQYPLTGWPTIRPAAPYAPIRHSVILDAMSQPGAGRVAIDYGGGGGGPAAPSQPPGINPCPNRASGMEFSDGSSELIGLAKYCYGDFGVLVNGGATLRVVDSTIGSDHAETPGLGGEVGVRITSGNDVRIVDTEVVANSIAGIYVDDPSFGDVEITGSFVGTSRNGAPDLGNEIGILVENSPGNELRQNVISGNLSHGIVIRGPEANGMQITNNLIGVHSMTTAGMRNGGDGLRIEDVESVFIRTVIGGNAGSGNLISNNGGSGIHLIDSEGVSISANLIGTTNDGLSPLGNIEHGIWIDGADEIRVGAFGLSPACTDETANVISANGGDGVHLSGLSAGGNTIRCNFIGTTRSRTPLGNTGAGVRMSGDDESFGSENFVASLIAFNGADGVSIGDGFSWNGLRAFSDDLDGSIHSNGELGIDLEDDGVTANDSLGDGDGGANHRQNFPVLDHAILSPNGVVTVRGSLESVLDELFSIRIFSNQSCDPSGYGEGELLETSGWVRTDLQGRATFLATGLFSQLSQLTATATRTQPPPGPFSRSLLETSEFSRCIGIQMAAEDVFINEIDATAASGGPLGEFIELSTPGLIAQPLSGKVLVLFDGASDEVYAAFDLDGFLTDSSGYFVAGNAGTTNVDLVFDDDLLLDGPAAVALYDGDALDFPVGSPVTTDGLVDALVYGPESQQDAGLLVLLEEGQQQVDEGSTGDASTNSNQRCPDGAGGARFSDVYAPSTPSPGAGNVCVVCELDPIVAGSSSGETHSVTATVLTNQISPTANIDVTFEILAGPNSGQMSTATTDQNGEATFDYTGDGRNGSDVIQASGEAFGAPFTCRATQLWGGNQIFGDGFDDGTAAAWASSP